METSVTQMLVFLATSGLVCFWVAMAAPASVEDFAIDNSYDLEKRSGYRPVPFPCNGYDNLPRCLHRGKGPRKTWTKSGRFCVCLCPSKWIGPECSYAAGSYGTFGKRDTYQALY